jgi:hypothetical protein
MTSIDLLATSSHRGGQKLRRREPGSVPRPRLRKICSGVGVDGAFGDKQAGGDARLDRASATSASTSGSRPASWSRGRRGVGGRQPSSRRRSPRSPRQRADQPDTVVPDALLAAAAAWAMAWAAARIAARVAVSIAAELVVQCPVAISRRRSRWARRPLPR